MGKVFPGNFGLPDTVLKSGVFCLLLKAPDGERTVFTGQLGRVEKRVCLLKTKLHVVGSVLMWLSF